jgi:fatty-acyl-CoA synthase
MLGIMQDWPLLLHRIIDHAAVHHPRREVVTRRIEDGAIHRTDYATLRAARLRVAQRLRREGIREGDRVGTLAWSTWRHLEAWFGIAGAGAVYHTINPRLFPDQVAWIANHAEDRILLADLSFVPLLEGSPRSCRRGALRAADRRGADARHLAARRRRLRGLDRRLRRRRGLGAGG